MRYNKPYIKARLVSRKKTVYEDGTIMEMRIWSVPSTARTPKGIKYSLVYIDMHGMRLLGYDNAEGKGHHKHEGERESQVEFISMNGLVEQFLKEVDEIRGNHYEN